ncbi:MAG: GNAT family N-acetyltransferase [Mediterranea sp.]|jgi:predicted nucleic acid-binding protein/ribosomal protein S18 acetylase RimI-like enzyme|nr:GNAT family N-acetyltransferase [Mediterranea sp.]
MQIEYIDNNHPFLQEVITLGNKHSSTLGFMPEGAFLEHAQKKWIIIAHDEENFVGYLMFRVVPRRQRIAIVHLCVKEDFRGKNVTTLLLDTLRDKYKHTYNGISLSCRTDYVHATEVWKRYGFVCKYRKRSRSVEENYLNVWWYDFNRPDLFNMANQSSLKVKALLDANIIIKLRDELEEYEPSQDPRVLLADWLVDEVDYYYAPEILNEITRDKNQERIQRTRNFLRNFVEAKFDIEECKNLATELMQYIHGVIENDQSDRIQLASAIASETSYFVTLDIGILEKRHEVEDKFNIQIFTPKEFVLEIDQLLNKEEYSPGKLAGVTLHTISKVSSSELGDYIDLFLAKSYSEKKASFQNIVLAEANNIQISKIKVVKANQRPIAFLGYRCVNGLLIVSFLRMVETEYKQTLFMQLVSDCINKAIKNGITQIQIKEAFLSESQEATLNRMGFDKIDAEWIKTISNLILKSSEIEEVGRFINASLIERLKTIDDLERTRLLIEIERKLFPLKFSDLDVPCYIIPIKPYWAGQLFDPYISGSTLFGADEKRMWNYENVYYRSTRPIKEIAPARILWYASADNKLSRQQAIIASSYLDEVMTDKPKILFRKNKHYGIYEWQNIYDLCNKNIEKPIRALRFSGTEVFMNPVKLSSIRDIFIANGKPSNTFASPVKIGSNIFNQIYQAGVRGKEN